MKIFGIDFTSSPMRKKPITCLSCVLENGVLSSSREHLDLLDHFDKFEDMLCSAGPWIAAIDFPFGLPRKFIVNMRWPQTWACYVKHASGLGREGFRGCLDAYRESRPKGDKEHRRATDCQAGSISPQKLYGVPVGLMFFEGARRLIEAGVTIPGLQMGDANRIVVEAYPGVLARKFIPQKKYKHDSASKQTDDQRAARRDLFRQITNGRLNDYGFEVASCASLADDPTGDALDALLCAIQGAWSWTKR